MQNETTNYRLWDNKEKSYINSVNYVSIKQAEEDKDSFLSDGNYPDEPHTVIQIHKFNGNNLVEDVTCGETTNTKEQKHFKELHHFFKRK